MCVIRSTRSWKPFSLQPWYSATSNASLKFQSRSKVADVLQIKVKIPYLLDYSRIGKPNSSCAFPHEIIEMSRYDQRIKDLHPQLGLRMSQVVCYTLLLKMAHSVRWFTYFSDGWMSHSFLYLYQRGYSAIPQQLWVHTLFVFLEICFPQEPDRSRSWLDISHVMAGINGLVFTGEFSPKSQKKMGKLWRVCS